MAPIDEESVRLVPATDQLRDSCTRPDRRDVRAGLALRQAFRDEAEGSGAPWLFGIAATCCASTTSATGSNGGPQPAGAAARVRGLRGLRALDERMAASELGPALHIAVERLPSPQRRALELRVVQQLSYDEVAGKLGCSQNAARLRVSRALRTLTLALGGAEGTAG